MATLGAVGRNAAIRAVAALLDSGDIKFKTAGGNEVAICTFAATAFANSGTGVETAAAIGSDTSAIAGTIASADLRKSDTTVVLNMTCSATGGSGEFVFPTLVVGTGDTVSVTSLTLTMPAS